MKRLYDWPFGPRHVMLNGAVFALLFLVGATSALVAGAAVMSAIITSTLK